MTTYIDTIETPLGAFTVAVDAGGALLASAFGGPEALPGQIAAEAETDAALTAAVRRQVEEYFEGQRQRFELPLAPASGAFQQSFRRQLLDVPFGATTTYSALAATLGSSPRAAGRANALNPLCLIVPCHRVVGSDGSLTGYAYGLDIKRALLEHEAAVVARGLATVPSR